MIRLFFLFLLLSVILILIKFHVTQKTTSGDRVFFSLPFNSSSHPYSSNAELSLSPSILEIPKAQQGTLTIELTIGDAKVKTVQLELAYSPFTLRNIQISPGTLMNSPIIRVQEIDPVHGRIRYVVSTKSASLLTNSRGTIAVLSFMTNDNAGDAKIFFLPKTTVYDEYDQPVLSVSNGSIIKIK